MKLRIKGNSIRLRLSKSEVEKVAIAKYLQETTSFGNRTFSYSLQIKDGGNELSADFADGEITVFIPESLIKDWAVNRVVGFESRMQINNTESLYILIEKDFQCLDKTMEDQSDNYENPDKTC